MHKSAAQLLLENLNRVIQSQGISQAELGRRTRVPQTTLNRMFRLLENGVSPRLETLDRLARGLRCSVSDLLMNGSGVTPIAPTGSPHLVARQIARLTEDFLLSSDTWRKEILRVAEECAAHTKDEDRQ